MDIGQGNPDSNAQRALLICPLFESEILVWLMLRNWGHPLAEDANYRSAILETATDVLVVAASHENVDVFIHGMPSQDMNLVSAVWYAENRAIEDPENISRKELKSRIQWLKKIKHSLPSCFCPVDDLPPTDFSQQ